MRNRITFSILVLCSLFLLGFRLENGVEKTPESSLLWKIEGPGLKKPSYLFGTMHLIQKQYYYFPESLEKIIRKSNVIVTEIDLDELNDQKKAMQLMTLKEGKLSDYFTAPQKDSISLWIKNNLKIEGETFFAQVDNFKPLVLVQTIIQVQLMGKTESYEGTIGNLAKKYEVETVGVEHLEDQIAMFDGLSKTEQAEMVMESLRNPEKQLQTMNDLQALYKGQNIDSIYQFMMSDGGSVARQQDLFIDQRNQKWIPQLEVILKEKSAFIAVGAGHLGGEKGVIQLLRNQGYTLTPVKF